MDAQTRARLEAIEALIGLPQPEPTPEELREWAFGTRMSNAVEMYRKRVGCSLLDAGRAIKYWGTREMYLPDEDD